MARKKITTERIIKMYMNDVLLEKDGFVNMSKGKIAVINGLDSYVIPNSNKRMAYQRPKI